MITYYLIRWISKSQYSNFKHCVFKVLILHAIIFFTLTNFIPIQNFIFIPPSLSPKNNNLRNVFI